jgi:hypothetical protein
MPTMKRIKVRGTRGVYYILGTSPATGKQERIYYIRYRDPSGKLIEEKCGRATVKKRDAETPGEMTALDASNIRADRMRGRTLSNRNRREADGRKKGTPKNSGTGEIPRGVPSPSRLAARFRVGPGILRRSGPVHPATAPDA